MFIANQKYLTIYCIAFPSDSPVVSSAHQLGQLLLESEVHKCIRFDVGRRVLFLLLADGCVQAVRVTNPDYLL